MTGADPFWTLPGPDNALRAAATLALSSGLAAMTVPDRMPARFEAALDSRLRDGGFHDVFRVKGAASRKSIVHRLAKAAGMPGGALGGVDTLVASPEASGGVFVVDRLTPEEWPEWAAFARAFSAERRMADLPLMPAVLVLLPPNLPPDGVVRVFGRNETPWRGRVSKHDMRSLVSRALGCVPGGPITERIAVETVVEMAGYDPEIAMGLARNSVEHLLEAQVLAREVDLDGLPHPTWSNGWMDEVDGTPVEHLFSLVSRRDFKAIERRVWQAQARVMLPLVEEALAWFCRKYDAVIRAALPRDNDMPGGIKVIEDPRDIEPVTMRRILLGKCTEPEYAFLKALSVARNKVAHFLTVEAPVLEAISSSWEALRAEGEMRDGWTWPRCGQRLTIVLGPAQGGKSRRARDAHAPEDIVDAEGIRRELDASSPEGYALPASEVRREAVRRVRERLAAGHNATLDMDLVDAPDRIALLAEFPPDIEVAYEVVDRPLDEKEVTVGRRPDLRERVKAQHVAFQEGLPAILGGDGRPNVKVTDLREESVTKRRAA